jgi:hypothetical protein
VTTQPLSEIREQLKTMLAEADGRLAALGVEVANLTAERNRLAAAVRSLDPAQSSPPGAQQVRLRVVSGRNAPAAMKARVLEWCRTHDEIVTAHLLCDAGIGREQSIRNALSDLTAEGKLARIGHGQYRRAA